MRGIRFTQVRFSTIITGKLQSTPETDSMRGPDEYPANLVEFIDWFPTDEACLEYLEVVR